MLEVDFKSMTEISGEDYELLLNDVSTVRHMPLHKGYMNARQCENWAAAKSNQWSGSELGPWAIVISSEFAGWGGMQPLEGSEVDFALVLHKKFWGTARTLIPLMIDKFKAAGGQGQLVTFLAKTRKSVTTMQTLGFEYLGEVEESGVYFDKFSLVLQAKE